MGKIHHLDLWERLEAVSGGSEDFFWESEDGVRVFKDGNTWYIESDLPYFQNMYINEGDYFSKKDEWVSDILDKMEASEFESRRLALTEFLESKLGEDGKFHK